MSKITYPAVRRDESCFDDFHGVKVPNPYAWLEDPDSEETKAFIKAQNDVTEPFISKSPVRNKFKERLTELWDYPKYGCPFRRGSRYFYWYNSGLQNQSVLYVQQSLNSEAEVFLDPNELDKDGLKAISSCSFSEDGELLAYGISHKGSDWITIKFMSVGDRVTLEDTLENVKFSCIEWTHDNKGIFYNRFPKMESKQDGTETTSNINQKLYYHRIGTTQEEDLLVAENPDHPKWMMHAEVSDDGDYVLLSVLEGCEPVNQLYCYNLKKNDYQITGLLPYEKIIDNFDAKYEYITNNGPIFTFMTNLNSPNYKLININIENHSMENWKVLVEEHDKDVLEWVACVNINILVLCYLHDVKNKLYLHHLDNGKRYKELPLDVGTIRGYTGRKNHTEMFYKFTSFLSPGIIYRCDFSDEATSTIFREIHVKGFDHSLFETNQVFYKSKDGTLVPMFIIHKKGVVLDGSHPCLLYGYGGFNISITPAFSVSRLIFIQHLGGVLAVANIRGGGEYGKTWHKSGCFANRQNAYDDFISAGEYLVANKYTSSERLTINGGSNGGLLVTVCMNQRPDLFKCVIGQVSVTDLLNFHKYTIGHAWTTDFGCADKEEDFEFLRKLSPLHNVTVNPSSQYPALLLLTADHDDRVVPLHSFKLIAEVQYKIGACENQLNPLLIKIDTKCGHGGGKPTSKIIEEVSDIYAFISEMVGCTWLDR